MNVFQMLGQKEFQLQQQLEEYAKLIHLVARIQSGEVDVHKVEIDLPDKSWRIVE